MELNDVLGQTIDQLGLTRADCEELQKQGVAFEFLRLDGSWDDELPPGGWAFNAPPHRYRVKDDQSGAGDRALIAWFKIPATPVSSIPEPAAVGDPANMPEPKHCELDWDKPAGPFDPFKGYTVESDPGHEPLDDAGPFDKQTIVDNHGRMGYVNLHRV